MTHRDLGDAERRQKRQIGGCQTAPGGQRLRALGNVLARNPSIGALFDRTLKGDAGGVGSAILFEHHCVDAPGQQRAGQNANGCPLRDRAGEWYARRRAARMKRQFLRAGTGGGMGKAVTIDGGIGGRRVGPRGQNIRRQHPTRCSICGDRLDAFDRGQGGPQSGQSHVDRQPVNAGRQGKAIVAQRRWSKWIRRRLVPDQPDLAQDETGNRRSVIEIKHWHVNRNAGVGRHSADHRVSGRDQRVGRARAPGLDLWMILLLPPLDQHQIDRFQLGQQGRQRWLGFVAQFGHQGPSLAADDQHLARAGRAVAKAVFSGLVNVKHVVRVLERRHRKSAPGDLGHQPLH